MIEKDEPAILLLGLIGHLVLLAEVGQHCSVSVSSDLHVLAIFLVVQEHLRANVVQKGALRLQHFDDFRNVLEAAEGFAVLLYAGPHFLEGLGVAGEEG